MLPPTGKSIQWHRRALWLALFGLLMGCSAVHDSPRRVTGRGAHGPVPVLLASTISQPTRIGWVYRIESELDGQPVRYVDSAADLKKRLTCKHQWAELLRRDSTRVYAMEVFGELDAQASGRGTLWSARNEALRAAEQRALDDLKKQVENANKRLPPGQKEIRILNEDKAAVDPATWEARHKVTTTRNWRLFEKLSGSARPKALAALTIFDAYLMYYESIRAPRYYKTYTSGRSKG